MQDDTDDTALALKRADLDSAKLDDGERALLEFVRLLTETPSRTSDRDVESLRQAGWTDQQIAETVYVTGLFAFFNRVADVFGLEDPKYGEQTKDGRTFDPQATFDPQTKGED